MKHIKKNRAEAVRLKTTELKEVRQELFVKQKGICPLCETDLGALPSKQMCVDHDHAKTGPSAGAIRGVLCSNCNGREGAIRNRVMRAKRKITPIKWLENLLAYWKKHSTNQTGLIHPSHKEKKKCTK